MSSGVLNPVAGRLRAKVENKRRIWPAIFESANCKIGGTRKDLDENKPAGSIRIGVETIDYFLRRYREDIVKRRRLEGDIDAQLAELELSLRAQNEGHFELALAGD